MNSGSVRRRTVSRTVGCGDAHTQNLGAVGAAFAPAGSFGRAARHEWLGWAARACAGRRRDPRRRGGVQQEGRATWHREGAAIDASRLRIAIASARQDHDGARRGERVRRIAAPPDPTSAAPARAAATDTHGVAGTPRRPARRSLCLRAPLGGIWQTAHAWRARPRAVARRGRAMRASGGVLLALAGLLALPAPAAAQTAIWSATLTAEENVTSGFVSSVGFSNTASEQTGSLSDDDFDLGGTTYTITALQIQVPTVSNQLVLIFDSAPGAAAQRLTLHLGSASFALSAATLGNSDRGYIWTGHGLTWSDDDTVQARLTLSNAAPDFGADSTTREVAENSDAGTNVGAAVTATDGNDDTLTYSLEGTDAASFQIVSASGQIQTTSGVTYDYETTPSYAVTVKADGGLGGTDTIAVAIDLTDVNEPPPTINNVALTSDPGADETYAIGDTVTATVTFDRAVAVTGTPQLTLRVGGGDPVNLKPANYTSGSGTTTLGNYKFNLT